MGLHCAIDGLEVVDEPLVLRAGGVKLDVRVQPDGVHAREVSRVVQLEGDNATGYDTKIISGGLRSRRRMKKNVCGEAGPPGTKVTPRFLQSKRSVNLSFSFFLSGIKIYPDPKADPAFIRKRSECTSFLLTSDGYKGLENRPKTGQHNRSGHQTRTWVLLETPLDAIVVG